jgi:uncharacterized protein (TIGR02677 family)
VNLVDANVLLYAVNEDSQHHHAARRWLDEALAGAATVAWSWPVLLAFMRIATRPGIFPRPLPVSTALDVVRDWLAAPSSVVVEPTLQHLLVLHLRPDEVVHAMAADGTVIDRDSAQTLLAQLVDWGNLRADPDTAEVATVEEFYRARFLYQLTVEGEAAERAVAHFEELLIVPGELQTSALSDIEELLGELLTLAQAATPDAGKVHRSLTTLTTRFEELTDRARTFITGLQRTVDLHGIDLDAFLAYKDRLIDYLERFIGDLVVAQGRIAALLADIDAAGAGRLLAVAADRDLADRLEVTDDDRDAAHARWTGRWAGLTAWFVAPAGDKAQADVLRERARRAIPQLLQVVSQINERRVSRADRPADLRTLARWFAQCSTDADAHRLWRAAFGLSPARHLKVDADTLDRSRGGAGAGQHQLARRPTRGGVAAAAPHGYLGPSRPAIVIVDRSADKALLARQAEEEAAQLAAARAQLVTDGTVRLSDLRGLDRHAFGLFLDLLGEALSAQESPPTGPSGSPRRTAGWRSNSPRRATGSRRPSPPRTGR